MYVKKDHDIILWYTWRPLQYMPSYAKEVGKITNIYCINNLRTRTCIVNFEQSMYFISLYTNSIRRFIKLSVNSLKIAVDLYLRIFHHVG
jgi:hypothetical protein